jgi:hypothetical protein
MVFEWKVTQNQLESFSHQLKFRQINLKVWIQISFHWIRSSFFKISCKFLYQSSRGGRRTDEDVRGEIDACVVPLLFPQVLTGEGKLSS